MKIYRIKLSNKDEIVIPEEKLTAVLQSKEQLVKVNYPDNDWVLINKAHIISAKVDYDETKRLNRKSISLLSAPEMNENDVEQQKKIMEKVRKELFGK